MSAHFTVYCETCDIYGPDIRRSSGINLWHTMPRHHPELANTSGEKNIDRAKSEWIAFLDEHEWHQLRLVHE